MEPVMSGLIEKTFDSNLLDGSLEELHKGVRCARYDKTREDAMFGFIVGAVFSHVIKQSFKDTRARQRPTNQEIDEMGMRAPLQERSPFIKSRILITLV